MTTTAASLPLALLGAGAVSPAGCSVEDLAREPAAPSREPLLAHPERTVPVRRVDPARLARWAREPRLRRASPLALFLAEASRQALNAAPAVAPGRLGLVAALGTGSISSTRQFYERLLAKGRAQAAPAVFPETVYNSPVSHVAALLGIEGACYTTVGDETAWVGALRAAQTWLTRGLVDAVLILAGEELDPIALEAYDRFGWFRRGLVATEGAGAVLVGRWESGSETRIILPGRAVSFRSRSEAEAAWRQVIAGALHPLVLPANIVSWNFTDLVPKATRLGPDHGFAFTASAAWSFLRAWEDRASADGPRTLLIPGANAAVASIDFP
jgi:hypothetical protein